MTSRASWAIEHATLGWLASHGIGIAPDEHRKLQKFNCRAYGGYSLPLADYHTATLITEFISLWLFWDDMQVEQHTEWSVDAVVAALAGPIEPPRNRYLAAWADLGTRLCATQSERWRSQLAAAMRQWLDNARLETAMATAYRDHGTCPELDALFERRTISIGMYPTFHLIELAEGFELPEALHADPTVLELKRLASRLVGMGNDLGGLAKDLQHRWINLVVAEQQRSASSIDDAFARIVAIHNRDVCAFDLLADRLPVVDAATDALLRGWIQAVRHNVYGFALWESTAERYQEYKAIVGGRALVAPVVAGTARQVGRALVRPPALPI